MSQKNGFPHGRITSGVCRALASALFILAALPASAVPPKSPLLNKPAPVFSRTSLESGPVNLAAFQGRVVLLNFWATWCAPCQLEMPRFVQWQQKYKADGLSILGVSMDDDSAPVKALLHQRNLNYPVIMGDEKLGIAYGGVLGLPVTYLIDRKGVIRARYQGASNLDEMERAVRQLLKRP